jgi:hypothetical protein
MTQMVQVIRHLSNGIGGRGSCTENERKAGEYTAGFLRDLGIQDVKTETFKAIPSTYWPYGLAFALALTGSLSSLLSGERGAFLLAVLFNSLGFIGMLAETELTTSWTHWFLPHLDSQNISGHIRPRGEVRIKTVVCAHLDTHRTPIFYSSRFWNKAFSLLVGLTLISMGVGAIGFGFGAILGLQWLRWLGLLLVPIQGFALIMCLHADFTPFSPGANDNASGVALALGLACQLKQTPLSNTEVHFVFTGCEEVGDWGMRAFLKSHGEDFGKDTFYIILDQVGAGRIKFLTADGLVIKHKTHKVALETARMAASKKPDLNAAGGVGIAYTDALKATQRGLIALTLCTVPEDGDPSLSHWHQMSDTTDNIVLKDLETAFKFAHELLRIIDLPDGR